MTRNKLSSFPSELLKQAPKDREKYFSEIIIAHPFLTETCETLLENIENSEKGSLIFVHGPSGVGKTTLAEKIQQQVTMNMAADLKEDVGRYPIVKVIAPAPDGGNFSYSDLYKRLLAALNEPCINSKSMTTFVNGQSDRIELIHRKRTATSAELRFAVERSLQLRRPLAALVDEAQHIAKIASGRRLQDQLDVIKFLSISTRIIFVLFGTYELLPFRNLSAQLSRRSTDIHFRRYRADVKNERDAFKSVVHTFQSHLRLAEVPKLDENWEFLYERSIGCVGSLRDWLVKALALALKDKAPTLELRHLQKSASSIAQCKKMLEDAREGEELLQENEEARSLFRASLGLEPAVVGRSQNAKIQNPSKNGSARTRRRPGQRNPKRDPVGEKGSYAPQDL